MAVVLVVVGLLVCSTEVYAASEACYYVYEGDNIKSSATPVKGKMYYPVTDDNGTVLFHVNMDTESTLFEGSEVHVCAAKLSILFLDDESRIKLLMLSSEPITEEELVETVRGETFEYAKKVAEEYLKAAAPLTAKGASNSNKVELLLKLLNH